MKQVRCLSCKKEFTQKIEKQKYCCCNLCKKSIMKIVKTNWQKFCSSHCRTYKYMRINVDPQYGLRRKAK